MGTRCLTYLYEENDEQPFFCLYRQYDGYRECHGQELAQFINGKTLVNGIPVGAEKSSIANGMKCLAAQIVVNFKTEVGGFYIYPANLDQEVWQDYEYHVWPNRVEVTGYGNKIFTGTWREFEAWSFTDEEDED